MAHNTLSWDAGPTNQKEATMAKDLSKLSLVQLAAEYNNVAAQLSEPIIKKFRDRKSGMQRTTAMLKQFIAAGGTTKFIDKKTTTKVRGRPASFKGQTLHPAIKTNPRQAGSFGWHSFEAILKSPGLTYEQYRECGGRNNDLRWDVAHGFVEARA
jgi:hypothetical protein